MGPQSSKWRFLTVVCNSIFSQQLKTCIFLEGRQLPEVNLCELLDMIAIAYVVLLQLAANYCNSANALEESANRLFATSKDKCTAIAVGRGATVDGSTMTTHTADCFECDWRVNKVRSGKN